MLIPCVQGGASGAAGGGAFNPISGVGWANAYWTGGTNFTALGYSSGSSVTSWPDEVGSANLAPLNATKPTYQSSSNLNSKPAVRFTTAASNVIGKDNGYAVSQPFTLVYVVYKGDNVTQRLTDTILMTGSRVVVNSKGTSGVDLFAGSAVGSTATSVAGSHLIFAFFSGASSDIIIDGTSNAPGANPGTNGFSSFALGSQWDNTTSFELNGDIAFVGIKSGALTSTEKSNLLTWSQGTYTTP